MCWVGSHLNPLSQAPGSASSGRLWTIPSPQTVHKGSRQPSKVCVQMRPFLHCQGPPALLAHLLCSTPPSTPSLPSSPLFQAGRNSISRPRLAWVTLLSGGSHTHIYTSARSPPSLLHTSSGRSHLLSWSTHVLWGPFHSCPELQL